MRVREIMTPNPKFCLPETSVAEVALQMVDCDCGEIPVVESEESMVPVGVVTDRDITCRLVAMRKDPLLSDAKTVMTSPALTVSAEAMVPACIRLMKDHLVRRLVVVDERGRLVGMISQADLIKHVPEQTAEVLRRVSQPSPRPSMQL
jgi:CBS domain-containing protein